MRFYAVCTEAIQLTNRALQQLDQQRCGSAQPGRALRMATLYGHLQCRADASGGVVDLTLRDLAASWCLQRRLLHEDLCDLQSLGWLRFCTGRKGTRIRLHPPHLPPLQPLHSIEQVALPSASAQEANGLEPSAISRQRPMKTATQGPDPAATDQIKPAQHLLIRQFAAAYNEHRPPAWPAYTPRGTALAARLQRALRHAGGSEPLWLQLAAALHGMPDFWRTTYPQGRSGPECAAVLFHADRGNAGLGPELWHVFTWAAGHGTRGATGAGEAQAAESELQRADRLLLWDGHRWRGQGEEALYLPPREKQRLAELLEAAGQGVAGTAAQQYGAAAEA
jgi:hypothetical protein